MTHYYDHNGFKKPGVTSIISDACDKSGPLTQWAANMAVKWIETNCEQPWLGGSDSDAYIVSPDELNQARFNYRDVSQEALDIGSEVHHLIEIWLQTKQEPINPKEQVLNGFVAFLEFYDEHEMKPFKLEHSVHGDYWGGTLDYYGLFNGKKFVIDFKTSKNHYIHEHGPQISAYRSCIPEAEGCGVLRLDKTTGYPDFKDYSKRWEKDLKEFKLMLPLYMHRHPRIAKAAGWKEN